MEFRYDTETSAFSLVQIQNEIVLGEESCFRCTRIASLSWAQLQVRPLPKSRFVLQSIITTPLFVICTE